MPPSASAPEKQRPNKKRARSEEPPASKRARHQHPLANEKRAHAILCYNKNAVGVCEETQRVDREKRQRLRKEEIARYSLAPCHHKYA